MFELISDSFKSAVNKLRFTDDEKALKTALDTLKKALLKADVHFKVCKDLLALIEEEVKQKGIGQKQFLDAIKNNLNTILGSSTSDFTFASKPPTVVLMAGLQGGGKTTSTIKLGLYLKLRKKKVLLAACDLQRFAAVEQLEQLAQANEIDLIKPENEGAKPLEVALMALKKAKEEHYDVLIIDSAGRLAIDEALMNELVEIKQEIKPDEIFYVADAMSGQEGVKTAASFNEKLGITGVIMSKFDADVKGGVAIGIAHQLGIPLRFVGTGEKASDLEAFIPDRVTGRIMGEGDLATLMEKTSAVFDEKQTKMLSKKLKKGEFNFNDFLDQLESVKKLGNLGSLVGMIPGMGAMAQKIKDVDLEGSKELLHIKAMISSMTPKERENPALLNNARKRRIALGSGLEQMQVNRFLKQFENASKMAKKLSKGGFKMPKQIPGLEQK